MDGPVNDREAAHYCVCYKKCMDLFLDQPSSRRSKFQYVFVYTSSAQKFGVDLHMLFTQHEKHDRARSLSTFLEGHLSPPGFMRDSQRRIFHHGDNRCFFLFSWHNAQLHSELVLKATEFFRSSFDVSLREVFTELF